MKYTKIPYLIVQSILLVSLMFNQWTTETSSSIVKSFTLQNTNPNSVMMSLRDMEYDSISGDFFYALSNYYFPDDASQYFIWRMDYVGKLLWGKSYLNYNVSYFSLEYSPTYQTLYYSFDIFEPFVIMRANSTNGDYLNSYQISDFRQYWYYHRCSLSMDELALFWNLYYDSTGLGFVRFDTVSASITIAKI